jgi:hypothetical protein
MQLSLPLQFPVRRVDVYRNLHRRGPNGEPVWSVRNRRDGVQWVDRRGLVLLRDVSFVVGPGGREQALREGRKCVHAFARGEKVDRLPAGLDRGRARRVTYDPFKRGEFFDKASGEAVLAARWVELGPEGVLAWE